MYELLGVPCQKMYLKYLCRFNPSSDCAKTAIRFRVKHALLGEAHFAKRSHWEGVSVLMKRTIAGQKKTYATHCPHVYRRALRRKRAPGHYQVHALTLFHS